MPISGWLGDRYGYRRIYLIGFTGVFLFVVGGGPSPDLWLALGDTCLTGSFQLSGLTLDNGDYQHHLFQ